jgi:hypothetical protein
MQDQACDGGLRVSDGGWPVSYYTLSCSEAGTCSQACDWVYGTCTQSCCIQNDGYVASQTALPTLPFPCCTGLEVCDYTSSGIYEVYCNDPSIQACQQ